MDELYPITDYDEHSHPLDVEGGVEKIPRYRGQIKNKGPRHVKPSFVLKRSGVRRPDVFRLSRGNDLRSLHSREQGISIIEECGHNAGYYDSQVPTIDLLRFI